MMMTSKKLLNKEDKSQSLSTNFRRATRVVGPGGKTGRGRGRDWHTPADTRTQEPTETTRIDPSVPYTQQLPPIDHPSLSISLYSSLSLSHTLSLDSTTKTFVPGWMEEQENRKKKAKGGEMKSRDSSDHHARADGNGITSTSRLQWRRPSRSTFDRRIVKRLPPNPSEVDHQKRKT